jgi:hypothetical protein
LIDSNVANEFISHIRFQQNIIERFPATLIQEPTAFTSNDPIEMYNNILVFIVGGESSSRSEMHIFQVSQSINQNFSSVVKYFFLFSAIDKAFRI